MDIEESTNYQPCTECDGLLTSGNGDGVCSYCHGTGELIEISIEPLESGFSEMPGICEMCDGSGVCPVCNGAGHVEEEE